MIAHLDVDELVSITTSSHGSALESIDHIAGCAVCRDMLADLDALRSTAAPVEPDAALESRIAKSLQGLRAPSATAQESRSRNAPGLGGMAIPVAVFVMAACSAWLVLALGGHVGQAAASPALTLRTIVVSVLAGGIAAFEAMRTRSVPVHTVNEAF